MDKSQLVKLLCELNGISTDSREDDEGDIFQKRYEKAINTLMCSFDEILSKISLDVALEGNESNKIKYMMLNFYILELVNEQLATSDISVLSVQETKNVKTCLKILMNNGILTNIQPKLPYFIPTHTSTSDIYSDYTLLKCTVLGFYKYMKYPNLRMLILPHLLQGMLVAFYQLAYCPLKKPTTDAQDKFVMTPETYQKLVHDQEEFRRILDDISHNIHPTILIRETMVLFQANAPLWFKKSISNTLTKIIRSPKGVQHIASALLSGSEDDTTKAWKILEVLTKLISSCRKFPDFETNICNQVLNLLVSSRDLLIFERLVVSCTKCLYSEDKELCNAVFVKRITTPLLYFANKEHQFRDEDVTDDIKQTVRLLYGCFIDGLPTNLLTTYINVLFHLYHLTVKSALETTRKELREILIKFLQACTKMHELLDNFIFGFTINGILQFRNDIVVEIDQKIIVRNTPHVIIYTDVMDTVLGLLNLEQKIVLFGFLLNCVTNKGKYFPTLHNSTELLGNEDHVTGAVLERLLTIHRILSQLAENKEVQLFLRNKPDDIINYINNVLSQESDEQLVFLVLMILDNLIANSSASALAKYRILEQSLSTKSNNQELKTLCDKLKQALNEEKTQTCETTDEKTEFEEALEDVYDPLLPVRGHGLLTLSKLLEKKDKQALERKQYLLNLFQLHLKDEDSFIYLNAVQGLAALADTFTDTVLETLCEEYSDFREKAQETRMKLGEVLVRVTKILGEMAPKYKALLLNTFLSGTKDDDHLIRASSLSNLGEVCRVLNYKLGTIVTEVLVCVHAIVATDKAVEARRAAVTVIRQLFVGLQSEMISFLKEEILPIYRTLKEIYYNDKDDIMRLQAQLALEELNENMKSFVFPNPQLNFEKKVIMLD
ncbi:transport and Golgi organization protein 6 homolog [Tribolium madens]|uniref:transport and Golgi organization protein 6 homolog n=1 Tax=Tribolium madens TaxID=41895 RepID=UPI001CF75DFE|nr:transport and Golgi organization protein 6 homolog [Tribolium madens]